MIMGGGGSSARAGSSRGGGDLCAGQELREEAAARSGDGGMRARVCARVRTPQGVGAVLLVGGAIVGAAVVAWRRRVCCHGDGAKNHRREQPPAEEVLDGGVVEDGQGKFDQSDEKLSSDDTRVGANGLECKATEDLQEIQEEDENVTDESVLYSCANFSEFGFQNGEPVEKFDQNSSSKCTEIIVDDTDSGDVKKADQNSSKSDIKDEIAPNVSATEGVENSDQSTLSTSSLEIAHEEHDEHNDDAEETASTQTTPRTEMMTHQHQILEELKTDTMTETGEAELPEGTTMEKNVVEHEDPKSLAEPVELVTSPVNSSLSSLLKPTEKKGPKNPGWNERGMKLEQDCTTNGELSKGGATQGAAVVTMDRRAASMAILALIFAVTIGVNIVVRLYSSLQAT